MKRCGIEYGLLLPGVLLIEYGLRLPGVLFVDDTSLFGEDFEGLEQSFMVVEEWCC